MSILEYGVGFLTVFYVLSFALNGAGKTKIVMIISIAGFLVNTVLNYILIQKYSLAGSATATTITSFIIMIWILYYLWREFKVAFKIKSVLKIIFSSGIIYIVSLFFSKGEIIFILWSIMLFALYFFLLYILGEIKKEDLEIFLKVIRRKKAEEVAQELSGNEPGA